MLHIFVADDDTNTHTHTHVCVWGAASVTKATIGGKEIVGKGGSFWGGAGCADGRTDVSEARTNKRIRRSKRSEWQATKGGMWQVKDAQMNEERNETK